MSAGKVGRQKLRKSVPVLPKGQALSHQDSLRAQCWRYEFDPLLSPPWVCASVLKIKNTEAQTTLRVS